MNDIKKTDTRYPIEVSIRKDGPSNNRFSCRCVSWLLAQHERLHEAISKLEICAVLLTALEVSVTRKDTPTTPYHFSLNCTRGLGLGFRV